MQIFADRREAGQQLARALDHYAGRGDVIVLALPRGGVPVGYEIARQLRAPLDVLVVRKLGVPGHTELAMGAIASGGVRVIDDRLTAALGIPGDEVEAVTRRELAELERRERIFRGDRPAIDAHGKITILVDDGLATGSTMTAALDAMRQRAPARLVGAVPVAPPETCEAMRARADEMICLATPRNMYAVGMWYEDFEQTSDAEVRALLDRAARELSPPEPTSPGAAPAPAA